MLKQQGTDTGQNHWQSIVVIAEVTVDFLIIYVN